MQCWRSRQKEVKLAPKIYFFLCFFNFFLLLIFKYVFLAVSWALQVCIYVKKIKFILFFFLKKIFILCHFTSSASSSFVIYNLFYFLMLFENHTSLSVLSEFILEKRWHNNYIYYYHLLLRIICQNEMIKLRLHISRSNLHFFFNLIRIVLLISVFFLIVFLKQKKLIFFLKWISFDLIDSISSFNKLVKFQKNVRNGI